MSRVHLFAVSLPLDPLVQRVQTKVKVDAGICRVALQISSNPNNEAPLSDLTIVMGAPNFVRGETLATQPAGGVWDKSKSTVVWCVSELGSGEKFQLQARFELEKGNHTTNDLNFPVLVRCQCLHVQLSDVEFEVSDSSADSPVDIIMKVARRYRLSHREKNG
jgi:Muniscin C-terminal mu homology domain